MTMPYTGLPKRPKGPPPDETGRMDNRMGLPDTGMQPQPDVFGPGKNLLGRQINPGTSKRLAGYQDYTDQAAGNLAGWGGLPGYQRIGPTETGGYNRDLDEASGYIRGGQMPGFEGIGAGGYERSPEAQRARELTAQGLENVAGGPSRQDLALETYRRAEEESLPETQGQIRALGQRAASLGRLGSGMVEEEAGDIFGARKLRLGNLRKELASESAGQELGDRLARLGAAQGAGGQFRGEDLDEAGFRQGLRGEARGERGEQLGDAYRRAGLGMERGGQLAGIAGSRLGALRGRREEEVGERGFEQDRSLSELGARRGQLGDLSALESDLYGRERGEREEMRGERGYQVGEEQRSIENARGQRLTEEDLLDRRYDRDMRRQELLGRYGFGGVSPLELDIADQYGGEAGDLFGGASELIRQRAGEPVSQGEPTPTASRLSRLRRVGPRYTEAEEGYF